jgi:hypothetical protein
MQNRSEIMEGLNSLVNNANSKNFSKLKNRFESFCLNKPKDEKKQILIDSIDKLMCNIANWFRDDRDILEVESKLLQIVEEQIEKYNIKSQMFIITGRSKEIYPEIKETVRKICNKIKITYESNKSKYLKTEEEEEETKTQDVITPGMEKDQIIALGTVDNDTYLTECYYPHDKYRQICSICKNSLDSKDCRRIESYQTKEIDVYDGIYDCIYDGNNDYTISKFNTPLFLSELKYFFEEEKSNIQITQ